MEMICRDQLVTFKLHFSSGLRIRVLEPTPLTKTAKSNSERCKEYRDKKLTDYIRYASVCSEQKNNTTDI